MRNPAIEAEDYATEARWVRLPSVDHFEEDQYFTVILVPIKYGDDTSDESEREDAVSEPDDDNEAAGSDEHDEGKA